VRTSTGSSRTDPPGPGTTPCRPAPVPCCRKTAPGWGHLLSLHPSCDGIGLRSGSHAVRCRAARPVRLPAAGGLQARLPRYDDIIRRPQSGGWSVGIGCAGRFADDQAGDAHDFLGHTPVGEDPGGLAPGRGQVLSLGDHLEVMAHRRTGHRGARDTLVRLAKALHGSAKSQAFVSETSTPSRRGAPARHWPTLTPASSQGSGRTHQHRSPSQCHPLGRVVAELGFEHPRRHLRHARLTWSANSPQKMIKRPCRITPAWPPTCYYASRDDSI
jgi:hypothetical protein